MCSHSVCIDTLHYLKLNRWPWRFWVHLKFHLLFCIIPQSVVALFCNMCVFDMSLIHSLRDKEGQYQLNNFNLSSRSICYFCRGQTHKILQRTSVVPLPGTMELLFTFSFLLHIHLRYLSTTTLIPALLRNFTSNLFPCSQWGYF